MKVQLVNSIYNDATQFYPKSKKLLNAGKNGYKIGIRASAIYNKNSLYNTINIPLSIFKQVNKETSVEDLPIVSGAIGLIIPVYLMSPILYILGTITKELICTYRKIHKAH